MDGTPPEDGFSGRGPDASCPDRRRFLSLAALIAAGLAVGCDGSRPAGRSRALPSGAAPGAAPPDPAVAATPPAEPAPKPTPPAPVLERPRPPASEPSIRVRIREVPASGSVTVASAAPGGRGRFVLVGADGKETPATEATQIRLASDGSWRAGKRSLPAGTLVVRGGAGLSLDGANFPGELRLVPIAGGFDPVFEVPLETYLPGVLAKELFNSWGLETHRAQAVAARSFALCEMSVHAKRHYDVVAGEMSQAWIGSTTHATSVQAVRQTRGTVMLWDGRVVPGYYSSCCGGRPATAKDAIRDMAFNSIPPLVAGADRAREDCCVDSPNYRWRLSLPRQASVSRIAAYGRSEFVPVADLAALARIEVAERNPSGRPRTYGLHAGRGEAKPIPSERLRWALNFAAPGVGAPSSRVKSGDFTATFTPTEITLDGRGFGHGAGMCQYGAEGMSRRGAHWREILARYYPGAALEVVYGG